jgi:hypothetical protein
VSNAANTYFTTTADQQAASSIINSMQAAFGTNNYEAARPFGFDLLSLTGKVSRAGTGSSALDGELLVEQTVQCSFDVLAANGPNQDFEGWPTDDHFDFASALTPGSGGTFYTRGGTSDSSSYPVIANLAAAGSTPVPAGNVSLLAPPATSSWSAILGQRVLFYGELVYSGETATGYDWRVLPRDAAFTPYAIVALCQGLNQVFDDADMVHQEGVGVIGFQEVETLCGMQRSQARLEPRGGFGIFRALAEFATASFTPSPLHATIASVASSTIGGSAGGAKGDEFTAENLPNVVLDLTVSAPKNRVKVNTGRFSAEVLVTTPAPESEPVGGIEVTLSVIANSGTGTGIFQVIDPTYTGCDPLSGKVVPPVDTTVATVGPGGTSQETKVVWNNTLCISKTGAVTVVSTSVAVGNPNAGHGTDSFTKLNVIP